MTIDHLRRLLQPSHNLDLYNISTRTRIVYGQQPSHGKGNVIVELALKRTHGALRVYVERDKCLCDILFW